MRLRIGCAVLAAIAGLAASLAAAVVGSSAPRANRAGSSADDRSAMMDFFDKYALGKSANRSFDRFPAEQELHRR